MYTFAHIITLLVTIHAAISAEFAPFVTFNNGHVTADKTCTDTEMSLISDAVKTAAVRGKRRRRLGLSQQHRQLQLLKCYPLMAWATNKCGGTKYTRRLDAKEASTVDSIAQGSISNDIRELQSNICAANITKFNAELDSAATKVSNKCRSFIATRSFDCRQVLDCDITTFHTWFANNDTKFKSDFPLPGRANTLCSRTSWAFQADTNFDVGTVQLAITGPNGYSYSRIEHMEPYYFFGNKGNDLFGNRYTVAGNWLQVGTYTMTAIASNAPNSPHVAQFNIIDCK